MKNALFLVLVTVTLASCKKELTTKEIVKQNIENHFLETAHDPESYEFVSMEEFRILYKLPEYTRKYKRYSNLYERVEKFKKEIISGFEKKINDYEKLGKKKYAYNINSLQDSITKHRKIIKDTKKSKEKYASLVKETKEDEILTLHTIFKCRAKNKMGAKVLGSFYVVLTDSLTVQTMEPQ